MHRVKLAALALLGLLASGCSSSSSTSTAAALVPLPQGFPPDARVENAFSARLTQTGLAVFQKNLLSLATQTLLAQGIAVTGGVLRFPVPETSGSSYGVGYTLCKGGPDPSTSQCIAEIDLAHSVVTELTPAAPHDVVIELTVPIRVTNLPVEVSPLGLPIDTTVVVNGNSSLTCDASQMTFQDLHFTGNLAIAVEADASHGARLGESRVVIEQVSVVDSDLVNAIHFCPDDLGNTILSWFLPLVGDTLVNAFTAQVTTTLQNAFCTPAASTTPACPFGSSASSSDGGVCNYADGTCVSSLLGLQGAAPLATLLAALSPLSPGGLSVLAAAGGGDPRPDDPTEAWGNLDPVASGVTIGVLGGALPAPPSRCVPQAQVTLPTQIPIPDELTANSVAGWQGPAPIDLGAAVSERFVNYALASTFNSGALCLSASSDQLGGVTTGELADLIPSLRFLTRQEGDAPVMLTVRPQRPPSVVFGTGSNMTTDALVQLTLPQVEVDLYVWSNERSLRVLTLAIDLELPLGLDIGASGISPTIDQIHATNPHVTNAELLSEAPDEIGQAVVDLVTGLTGKVLAGSVTAVLPSQWTYSGAQLTVPPGGVLMLSSGSDRFLGLFAELGLAPPAGHHVVRGTRAAIVSRDTRDLAARQRTRPRVGLHAGCTVEPGAPPVEYAYRLDGGLWHVWSRSPDLLVDDPGLWLKGSHAIEVKARHVGEPRSEDPAHAKLDVELATEPPAARSGCSTAGPGEGTSSSGLTASALALLAVVRRRRRGVRVTAATGLVVASAALVGCGWGNNSSGDAALPSPATYARADAGYPTKLRPGLIGSYTSAAVASDGTIWVSGYEEADWVDGVSYGDLAVGKWNATAKRVDWSLIDGVPSTPAPNAAKYDTSGWRGGQAAPGDDVGMWTSLVLDASGSPRIAYYDATHGALKFAYLSGSTWQVSTVFSKASIDAGRYAKLRLVQGLPVIAFQAIGSGSSGAARSSIMLARGHTATPSSSGQWTFEEVAFNDATPCRQVTCTAGQVCFAATSKCASATTDCTSACGSGQACSHGTCVAVIDPTTHVDSSPVAIGDYLSLAVGPAEALGLVWADRLTGSLVQARSRAGAWTVSALTPSTVVKLDAGADAGSGLPVPYAGVGASLTIDASGTWHVAYALSTPPGLLYMRIPSTGVALPAETVDDGYAAGGKLLADGPHSLVDTTIAIASSGQVCIAYQDSTAGQLRLAVGTASGQAHSWKVAVLDSQGSTGYVPTILSPSVTPDIVTWWRTWGGSTRGDVRLVTP